MHEKTAEFMERLGISPASDWDEVFSRCESLGDANRVQQLEKIVRRLIESESRVGGADLYNKKNAQYELAVAFTGSTDYNFFAAVFDWITEHEEAFGAEILDVGCDVGFTACFLGTVFPEKHITGIDKNEKAIAAAAKLAESMGLTNVTFRRETVQKAAGKYDTVFSSRTLCDNFKTPSVDHSYGLTRIGNAYLEAVRPYAVSLHNLVSEGGSIVCFEDGTLDGLTLGWMHALCELGDYPDGAAYRHLTVTDVGEEHEFQACIYHADGTMKSADAVLDFFIGQTCAESEITDPKVDWSSAGGWAALSVMHLSAGSLIEGYVLESRPVSVTPAARYAVYASRNDLNGCIYYEFVNGMARFCTNSYPNELPEIQKNMRQTVRESLMRGTAVYRLSVDANGTEHSERIKSV